MSRIGRRAARLCLYLFLLLFVVGLVLVLAGVDLVKVDLWLEDRGEWFDAVGSRLFSVIWGGVFALCIVTVLGGLWQRFVAPRSHMGNAADFVVEAEAGDGLGVDESGADEFGVDELVAEKKKPLGWGCMVVAAIVGYFAWFGLTA